MGFNSLILQEGPGKINRNIKYRSPTLLCVCMRTIPTMIYFLCGKSSCMGLLRCIGCRDFYANFTLIKKKKQECLRKKIVVRVWRNLGDFYLFHDFTTKYVFSHWYNFQFLAYYSVLLLNFSCPFTLC